MLKKFNLLFLILFLFSCDESKMEPTSLESININNEEIIIDTENQESLIDQTTDKDIDELIDVLFDTNY